MYKMINSAFICGVKVIEVIVEVDVSNGLPSFDMVGLLSSEVREARQRVRIAIKNSDMQLPSKRITVNISPADVKKDGTRFDLAIATGILANIGYLDGDEASYKDTMIIGELGIDGYVRPVNGILAIAAFAQEKCYKSLIIPADNYNEASIIEDITIIPVGTLTQLVDLYKNRLADDIIISLKNACNCQPNTTSTDKDLDNNSTEESATPDFAQVSGQEVVKRAAIIAVSGMHNMLIEGPPGAGKSMIAKRIPYILPDMSKKESLEVTKIYSIAGLLKDNGLIVKRPFRMPHHTITTKALVGGGVIPKAGEVTYAHKGVLFLDEMAEFKPETLDALRGPIEDKVVTIARTNGNYEFPAEFMLVGAMNPCKCGYYPDRTRCDCQISEVIKYQRRVSGPMLDRFDIQVTAKRVDISDITRGKATMSSKVMREMSQKARAIQTRRFNGRDISFNSQMNETDINTYCILEDSAKKLLEMVYSKFALSTRGYYKVIKVARTIADIEESDIILKEHIAEAIGYKVKDK